MIDDAPTIRMLKTGDEKVIRQVYDGYKPGFMLFAKKYSLGDDLILDIYQDAMIALCENARKGKLDALKSSLKTYFFAIGKYMIYAKLKKEDKTTWFEQIEDVHFEWELSDEEDNESIQILNQAFEGLGAQCKQILKLFYYEERNLDEITVLMDYENKDVAKSQKSRCLKQLKALTKRPPND
ncbi:MAG: sigma-70 family RNA polymerase sigma factor [Flavobacterium sp.]|nr:sigma-70 family RNA polymerase sigma factor [Flavobacterium sp.]